MIDPQPLRLETPWGTVRGTLDRPVPEGSSPAVLLCGDLPHTRAAHDDLLTALAGAFADAGVAVARFRHAWSGDGGPTDGALVDESALVLAHLLEDEAVDSSKVAVVGVGTGAITAGCLAKRSDQIRATCLVAPIAPADIASRSARRNGAPPLIEPDAPPTYLSAVTALDPVAALDGRRGETLVLQAAADRVVAPGGPYRERLRRWARFELVARAGHAFDGASVRAACAWRAASFVRGVFQEMAA